MELRKKPIFWQRLLETLFRLRLIFMLLSVVLLLFLFYSRSELFSFILGASESFSITMSSILSFTDLRPYIPLFGGFLIIFILRLFLGGLFSGLVFLATSIVVPLGFFILDGSDNVVIKLLLWSGLISFLLSLLVPKAWVKTLFPLFVSFLLLTISAVWTEVNHLACVLLLVLLFADAITVGWFTGVNLKKGKPKAGSLIQASLKQLPVIASGSFIALLIALFMGKGFSLDAVLSGSLFWIAYLGVFFLLFSPYYSFMPLDGLRSDKRQMKMDKASSKRSK